MVIKKRENPSRTFYSLRISYMSLSEEVYKVPHQNLLLDGQLSYQLVVQPLSNATDLIFLIYEMRELNKVTLRFLSALTVHGS